MTEQQRRKQHIRAFMQVHYTDERLAQILAHAQDGRLAYTSCCCLIGARTAQHALQGKNDNWRQYSGHESPHTTISGHASSAYCDLHNGLAGFFGDRDKVRRRILIPMIRAEMRRRERLKKSEVIAHSIIQEAVNA